MSNEYWADRMQRAMDKITRKNTKQVNEQIAKYYERVMKDSILEFQMMHIKVMNSKAEGIQPTPADLYKMDKYWQLQAQLKIKLEKMGKKQITALSNIFELNFFEVYYAIALPGVDTFNTLDDAVVQQMINQIWCADGKSWSARIWENTEKLAEELNEGLIHCVAAGKTTDELTNYLEDRFKVSYSAADSLVRTELAHIQTQAAQKRYEDYGITWVQVWADEDERRCEICGKLHEKKIPISAQMPIPAHPRCRCCIIPVVE